MQSKPIKVVYIAGSGRSGSTLLVRMLRQTGLFADIGELRYLWLKDFELPYLCGCGKLISKCDFWQPVIHDAFYSNTSISFSDMQNLRAAVDRFRRVPQLMIPWRSKHFQNMLNQYQIGLSQLYRAILHRSGREYILDSSKDISTLLILLQMPEIELYVIHLVRDSRAVAYSWKRKKPSREAVENNEYLPVYPEYRIAAWWLTYQLFLRKLLKNHPRSFLIKYEELINTPGNMIMSILGGLQELNIDLDFINDGVIKNIHEGHSISGNPNRFDKGAIKLTLDTEWVTNMSNLKKALVTLITLPGLIQFGYLKQKNDSRPSTST